jgi:hypothetical protein
MKKNFFKKLSFVIALAMIISAIAPAAGAFAAESAHLNATKKYLHLSGVTGPNEYDFNIANKQKGWKYAWTSSNADVVAVDPANGLATATGVGSAKVTVAITDKDGADVDTLSADVIVRDNIKAITSIYFQGDAAQDLNKLEVNKGYDFGRKFETEAGSTTKTSAVTRWFVNSDKASIDAAGVFKATEPGTYTITAVAFQSTDKYNAWAALKDTTSTVNVLASKTLDVKVVNDVTKAEQLTATTAKLTFASPKKDASAADLKVSMLVGTTKVYQTVKKVTPSEDGLTATVEMYASFTAGTKYVFDYTNMTSREFTGASANVSDVARVEVSTTQATVSTATPVVVKLYNKDNVELTSIDNTLSTRVVLSGSSNKVAFDANAKTVYFFTAGDSISLTATFHTYDFDQATGTEKNVLTATGTIVGVPAAAAATVSSINTWTITALNGANFSSANHVIAAEDPMSYLYVKLIKTDNTNYVDNTGVDATKFRFQSSDSSVLNVGTSGAVYGVKEGTANVIVTYSDASFVNDAGKVIGAIPVVVSAKRAATQLTLSANNFTLSNSLVYTETKDVTITLKDQYGAAFPVSSVDVTAAAVPAGAVIPYTGKDNTKVSFAGAGRTVGTYAYTVKVNGISQMIVVNVAAPSANASVSYKLSAGTSFDVKLPTSTGANTVDATVSVVGYAANGVAYETVTPGALTANGLSINLQKPDGSTVAVTTGSINLASATGATVFQAAAGNYTLTLTKTVNGYSQVIDQVVFTVSNTQSKPTLEVKALVAPTATTVAAALAECFTVKLDGVEKVVAVDVTKGDYVEVAGSKNVFVKNVRFSVLINGATLEYVVTVNQMITLK